MFTKTQRSELEKLLDEVNASDEAFNIHALEGYFYAVAIAPAIIMPSEWLPVIFGTEQPEFTSDQQAKNLIDLLMLGYNHSNRLRIEGRLRFPFDMKKLTPETFDAILDWNYGFLQGLRLRMEIWLRGEVARDLGEEIDPVAQSVAVSRALLDLNEGSAVVDSIKADLPKGLSPEEMEIHLMAALLNLLPSAVEVIQGYAEAVEERREAASFEPTAPSPKRSRNVGRNEPCPCGSGKKYKKCCGAGGKRWH